MKTIENSNVLRKVVQNNEDEFGIAITFNPNRKEVTIRTYAQTSEMESILSKVIARLTNIGKEIETTF